MIRMTWTITADGTIFLLFASILHLTERELPKNLCPPGILILHFPGMCVGSAVDSRIRQIGYVAFVRQGVDESLVFREYIKLVFIPQVKLIRQLSGFIHGNDEHYKVIKGVRRMESAEPVEDNICKEADAVYALVLYRFGQHFIDKSCEDKKDHFAIKWAKQIVATMAYFGHIKQGISSLSTTAQDCLLKVVNILGFKSRGQ